MVPMIPRPSRRFSSERATTAAAAATCDGSRLTTDEECFDRAFAVPLCAQSLLESVVDWRPALSRAVCADTGFLSAMLLPRLRAKEPPGANTLSDARRALAPIRARPFVRTDERSESVRCGALSGRAWSCCPSSSLSPSATLPWPARTSSNASAACPCWSRRSRSAEWRTRSTRCDPQAGAHSSLDTLPRGGGSACALCVVGCCDLAL